MNLDTIIFYSINHLPHTPTLDAFALGLHLVTYGGLLYYPIILASIFLGNAAWRQFGRLGAVSLIATYAVSDLILKKVFERARPYQFLENVYYIEPGPSNTSLPSGQTAAAFAFAVLVALAFPNTKLPSLAYLFAFFIALDRVYMGHHYPSDVLLGAAIGSMVSFLVFRHIPKYLKSS